MQGIIHSEWRRSRIYTVEECENPQRKKRRTCGLNKRECTSMTILLNYRKQLKSNIVDKAENEGKIKDNE